MIGTCAEQHNRRSIKDVIDAGEVVTMTYRCEACQINWAAAHTRGGTCAVCGSGTKRIGHEKPDEDSAVLYRAVILNEKEAERSRKLHIEFEAFYENEWPKLREQAA